MSVTKVTSMMSTSTKGGDIPSASTLVIDTDGDYFDITGTTGITAMTVDAGRRFTLQFDGALTLTHGSSLYLPGATNFTTEANDCLSFIATAANTVRCTGYALKDGGSPVAPAGGGNFKNGMTDFDLSSSSDTEITVTGLGFTPTHLILQIVMSSTTQMVVFSMMGNATHSIVTGPASTAGTYTWNNDPQLLTGSGVHNLIDLESLDSDGFTLGNTKTGSPTGTAKIQWMAFG